jgi:nucleoside-diphosphate-sugar epimerase
MVAGASGLVGNAALRRFSAQPNWGVIGVSRRRPAGLLDAEFVALDLSDAAACAEAAAKFTRVTHLVYAALYEVPGLFSGWVEQEAIDTNATMLRNLFEPLSAAATGLRHVSLLHGTKAYGLHHPLVGRAGVRNPLREREPRQEHPNFYFLQEDYLRGKQRTEAWQLTVFRPTVIYGDAWGNNMNPLPVIAAYAALKKAAGEPLDFPGRAGHSVLHEAVDAELVAEALSWAAISPTAAGGTFNLTNGDVFQWDNVWPSIAETLAMEIGDSRPLKLAEWLPQKAEDWARLVDDEKLTAPRDLLSFVGYNSLVYTDMVLAGAAEQANPILNSTIAVRQAGFQACMDSEGMFRQRFAAMRRARLIP